MGHSCKAGQGARHSVATAHGGEPLLRRDFDEIYTACKSLGLLTSVNTNGVLLDEDKLRLLREYPPQRVNISLYGASPKTYGRLCGDPDAYSTVTESIIRLHEAGIGVRINYSATPDNVGDAAAIQAFADRYGLPVQATFHMFPPFARAAKPSDFRPKMPQRLNMSGISGDWGRVSLKREPRVLNRVRFVNSTPSAASG